MEIKLFICLCLILDGTRFIECFNCLLGNDAPSTLSFDTVTQCGVHEICSLEQYVTPSGLIRYNAGCKDTNHCGGSEVQDPNLPVCSECCSGDLCAVSLCSQSSYDTTSGPICYDCTYAVDSPDLCEKIKQCSRDQFCGTYLNPENKYTLKCMEAVQCTKEASITTCATCCTGTLCNDKCAKTNITQIPDCYDDTQCLSLLQTFHNNGRNLCDEPRIRHLCNETCGLCPTLHPPTSRPCNPNPCVHGVCTKTSSGVTCTCDVGFTGPNCDLTDLCRHQPCMHGTCVQTGNDFTCNCDSGYSGLVCDEVVTSCSGSPCGKNGVCTIQGASYTCNCNVGHVGGNCQTELKDCQSMHQNNVNSPSKDDVYVAIVGGQSMNVRCDMFTDGGGWTILMNRINDDVNFKNKDLSDFASGFGQIRGNYWIGLEKMHAMTSDGRPYQLMVEISDAYGNNYYEIYDNFSIGPPKDFVLHVGAHRGTAGDSLSGHNGFGFSTAQFDRDSNSDISCANYIGASWWFHNCCDACLTCDYITPGNYSCQSMMWNSYKYCIALRSARMMVRPM